MFPFWDVVIEPIFRAVDARRVVEVGALRGENTVQMLDALPADAELHVVDPVPAFDPEEHAKQFGGRYVFHQALSLEVLDELPTCDVALLDGDHNWYTVYNELRQLDERARADGKDLPVCILHDVGWPYGRRDLYYAPETIPEEYRQPYAQRGMRPGRSELNKGFGGLNPTMYNALTEGGPRNGVMTGIEDFVAGYDGELVLKVIPIYFGLAIICTKDRLVEQPELAAVLERIESTEGQQDLLELAEDTRIKAMLFQHNVLYHRERLLADASRRYLDLLKKSLLNETYLDHELRINYLMLCIKTGQTPGDDLLRDPRLWMRDKHRRLEATRRVGRIGADTGGFAGYFPYTDMGRIRLDHLETCLDVLREEKVAGDMLECGVGRGGGGVFMRGYLASHAVKEGSVYVADRFRATRDEEDLAVRAALAEPVPVEMSGDVEEVEGDGKLPGGGEGWPLLAADLNAVRRAYDTFDLLDDRVRFLQGEYTDTLARAPFESLSIIRLGDVRASDITDILELAYPKLSVGGAVIVDGYRDPARAAAVDAFRSRHGIEEPLDRIDWAGAVWRKQVESPVEEEVDVEVLGGAPLVGPPRIGRKDLTVVVVFYNMVREAERTLHALSRAYQQGVDDIDYEVVVVENGSDPDQILGKEYVKSFGPEFRYINMGRHAHPSPVKALNRGILAGKGDNFALMIDGAHVLTPGVLRYGMDGLRTYEPAVVSTQQWYVGPGQQGESMADGYDQTVEDRLFEHIAWPNDGYRLFDISHFIGERDWLDGMWESNCLFVPRSILQQVGAFDESFDLPGGEYANLDIYERVASSPDANFTTILGEGSFHQVHGGTTTNQPELEKRRQRIASYAAHYAELRGRGFKGHQKRIHYVGTMFAEANRTRARRRVSVEAFRAGMADPDGRATEPMAIPEELQSEYTEAFWRSLRWEHTSFLGKRIRKTPNDLWMYQELIHDVRPDWVIETPTANGARTLYLASICELVGHGQVLSVGAKDIDKLPRHPRITYLEGDTFGPAVTEAVREVVGDDNALVLLGSRGGRPRVVNEFDTYSEFVGVGSYVIVEDTIVNGHPVWASFGPGPYEAVKQILNRNSNFVSDLRAEKYGTTFNPSGFLQRLS